MDKVQRVDEKNGIIRLVMFTSRVMVFKMSKMAHFMYLLLNTAHLDLSQNTVDYVVLSYH